MGVDYQLLPSGLVMGQDGDMMHLYSPLGDHIVSLHDDTAEEVFHYMSGRGVNIPRDWQSANSDSKTWKWNTSYGNPALLYLRKYIGSTPYPMLRTQTLLMLRQYFGKTQGGIWPLVPLYQVEHAVKVMRKIVGDDDFYRTVHWLPTGD